MYYGGLLLLFLDASCKQEAANNVEWCGSLRCTAHSQAVHMTHRASVG